jgi:hypothetical protein
MLAYIIACDVQPVTDLRILKLVVAQTGEAGAESESALEITNESAQEHPPGDPGSSALARHVG